MKLLFKETLTKEAVTTIAAKTMKYTLKQCKFYTFFTFPCNFLNISGRKLPGFFLKKEMTKSKLHKNKEAVLKFVQYWVHTCNN